MADASGERTNERNEITGKIEIEKSCVSRCVTNREDVLDMYLKQGVDKVKHEDTRRQEQELRVA